MITYPACRITSNQIIAWFSMRDKFFAGAAFLCPSQGISPLLSDDDPLAMPSFLIHINHTESIKMDME